MIVRQFISWIRTAPAGERAEATRALARAWLISDLTAEDRAAAEGALLMLLDDGSPLVRQAMAEVFARSTEAPAGIVQALSLDQPSVALPVLEYSPLLIDADLVDIIATGNCETQCAVARRINLPASVAAAIAEVGTAAAALELIENAYAELAPFSWDRIVERHGMTSPPEPFIGGPEEIAEKLAAYWKIGVKGFIVAFADPFDTESIERLGNEVRPLVEELTAETPEPVSR